MDTAIFTTARQLIVLVSLLIHTSISLRPTHKQTHTRVSSRQVKPVWLSWLWWTLCGSWTLWEDSLRETSAVTNDFSVKLSLRLASSLLSYWKVFNNLVPLIKPAVPPRAAEIEFKASLHQKCRTFLKLSHQERLISRRGSVWTSADDEKKRLQKVFVQWVCVTTISQQSRGCAEMCCNQKKNNKRNAVMWNKREYQRLQRVITLRSRHPAFSSRQYEGSEQPHGCSISEIIFTVWRRHIWYFRRNWGSTSASLHVAGIN